MTLEFEDDALEAVAKEAIKRNTGARGLRAILEQSMLEVIGAILVGAFALTFGVLSVGPMMLKPEDV